jgi:hypothetical protein
MAEILVIEDAYHANAVARRFERPPRKHTCFTILGKGLNIELGLLSCEQDDWRKKGPPYNDNTGLK